MKSYQGLALRELLAQRVTSALILLAILLSTTMTAVIGQSAGVLAAMRQQQAIALGGDRYATFVQCSPRQVEEMSADPRLSYMGTFLRLGSLPLDQTLTLSLIEYQEDVAAIYPARARLREGRLPEAPLELALPEDVLHRMGLTGRLGETVTLPLSKSLRHGVELENYDFTASFTLVGVTESDYLGYIGGLVSGIAGPGTGEKLLPEDYRYYCVDFRTADKDRFQETVNDLFAQYEIHPLDIIYNIPYLDALGISYDISDTYESLSGIDAQGFPFLLAAGVMVGGLVLLAAGLVIYNILKIAVSRRIGQYGILRAMGGTKGQVYFLVAAQVVLLCAAGIPAGLLLGALSARGILTAVAGQLSPNVLMARDQGELARLIAENSGGKGLFLLASAAITLVFALLASLPAARYAANVPPTVAMAGQRARVRGKARRIRPIRSFERHCALLNLRRSPGRTALTILSLMMSITVFVALQGSVALLDTSRRVSGHLGDYSVVNQLTGFSPEELSALARRDEVASVATVQLALYDIDGEGAPVGIEVDLSLCPGETFQVAGINEVYWDAVFGDWLEGEVLARLKAGEGCVVRNPFPLQFQGEELPRTQIQAGSVITVAGVEVPVLGTLDGYDTYIDYIEVGNGGFTQGVQLIVSPEAYTRLTGQEAYHELTPALTPGADRAAFDEALEALARRTPGTSYLSYQESDRQVEESFRQTRLLAWGLILFVGLIGLLNVVNTSYTNIHTRVAEIGMQRAIGMSAGSLYRMFLWEGAYYGMIAAVLGCGAGYLCTILTEGAAIGGFRLPPVPVLPMAEAALLSVGACLLATALPLRRISRLSIVESIEGVE